MLSNTIKTRGLHVGVRFAPPAGLDKTRRQQFQNKASIGFDWMRHEYTDKVWLLTSPQTEGDPRSQLKLTLQPEQVNFEDFFPVAPFDVFLDNVRLAMETVADVFTPKIMLGSGAMIRMTAEVHEQDARVFLGNRCLGLDERLTPIGRPVHAVGLRLLLPPIPLANNEPPWQAEIKIESLVEDVRQLFIEVDAKWAGPSPWNLDELVRRIRIANDFARNQVLAFLTQYEEGG
ncbi:MAG: hypothetical protein HUU22_07010 [Phycisphaerae bacterium]|nr:hypothetical protein [Phycisphaerae bacterium]NUQ45765.1 hypothetical protein [Phycisphaerae bacterium]